ncbi:glycosyltransferase [Planococcus sp. X10-3]|uniref:glycosyltransferase n=1 Tax=Planococcus sp. X10-3 TaxID=3061240 RepID=UPI003BB218F5
MKILHIISGGETGGSKKHLLQLFQNPPFEAELVLLTEGEFAEEARNQQVKVTVIQQNRRFDGSASKKILSYIEENDFSLVHSHGARSNFLVNNIKSKLRIPWFVTVHSDPSLDFLHQPKLINKIFTFLNKRALRNADHLFAVSEKFKNMLIEMKVPAVKISPIFNGIEFHEEVPLFDKEEIRKTLDTKPEDFVYSIVARLHPVKGHEVLLKAFKDLPMKNVKLWIIGDGQLKGTLMKMADSQGIMDKVQFLGTRKDVDQLLFASDVSLLTSYSESFPLVLLESADMGTPVISTDVGGVKSLINPGVTGWIIPPNDKDALMKACVEAYNSDAEKMGKELREYAKENFSNKNLQDELYRVYLGFIAKE